jgi:hypothetical protein
LGLTGRAHIVEWPPESRLVLREPHPALDRFNRQNVTVTRDYAEDPGHLQRDDAIADFEVLVVHMHITLDGSRWSLASGLASGDALAACPAAGANSRRIPRRLLSSDGSQRAGGHAPGVLAGLVRSLPSFGTVR